MIGLKSRFVRSALLIAGVLAVYINLSGWWTLAKTDNYYLYEIGVENEDQLYYLSRIREIRDGYPLIGNTALKEHREKISPNGWAEWLPAYLGASLGLSVEWTIIVTNFLFPLLIFFFTALWLKGLLKHYWLALLGMVIIWFDLSSFIGVLRETSPKTTMIFPSVYLTVLFVLPHRPYQQVLRGGLIGVMLYTYHYHWTVLLAFEGLWSLWLWYQRGSFKRTLRECWLVWVSFGVMAIPYALKTIGAMGDPVAADTWRRFGAIPTRLPPAPILQATLLSLWLPFTCLTLTGQLRDRGGHKLWLLLTASLVAVNSNIITGLEAEFAGHYGRFVRIFVLAGLVYLAREHFAVRWQRRAGIFMASAIALVCLVSVPRYVTYAQRNATAWQEAKYSELFGWLDEKTPAESVILAPASVASRIPVYTDNYVWLNYGARSFSLSEYELIERYNLQILLFPENKVPIETGTLPVFGNYTMPLFAKSRTWHFLTSFGRTSFDKTLPDFIANQEHRRLVERLLEEPDVELAQTAMEKYELSYALTQGELPTALADEFELVDQPGEWSLWKRL